MMKNKFTVLIISMLFILTNGCHEPDELLPSVSREGINSITASFADGTGSFTGSVVEGTNEIVIPIPYFFPENSDNQVTEEQLSKMRVKANLDDNVVVSPSLLYMDLTQENMITVTDQRKQDTHYIVKGEIRKSSEASIEEFSLPAAGLNGVINESSKTISLIAIDDIEPSLANLRISSHASISPDPRVEELNYNEEVELTVTAHDGVTQNVYTVKKEVPGKLEYGIRPGSAKLMFAKKLNADLGITVDHLTGGLAATGNYIVLNTRNQNSIYLDAKTGEKIGEVDLGPVKGSLVNFYNTADDDGNILINNLSPNDGAFKVWKLSSVNDSPELIIEWDGGEAIGRKLSIQGSLDSDAIISAPLHGGGQSFARWQIIEGQLVNQTPEIVTMTGLHKDWTTNVDVVYTSGSEITSDYFVTSYSANTFAWVDGNTNSVSSKLEPISANYIPNAVDYIEFNNAEYATLNWVNSFTWGSADKVWLLDVSSEGNFNGSLSDGTVNAVVWEAPGNTYGAKAISPVVANANGTGDVALTVSENGYYMYLYFMFTNGYVVGYQFDAIDM